MFKGKAGSVVHGRHTIRVLEISGEWKARAFLTDAPKGKGFAAEGTAGTRDAAVAEVAGLLDERDRALRERRRLDEGSGYAVPATEEFERALITADPSAQERAMLTAHAGAGASGLTAGEIAAAGGYADLSSGNLLYGKLARRLAERIGAPIPPSRTRRGDDLPTLVIAAWHPVEQEAGSSGRWVMYPEMREAVARALLA